MSGHVRWTPHLIDAVEQLAEQGLSDRDIARLLGLPWQAVQANRRQRERRQQQLGGAS